MARKKSLVLGILDGWGVGPEGKHNPIFLADTPEIDKLYQNYPNTIIQAAGEGIGLEKGHQGSSEIGHLIMGAGRNVLLPQFQVRQAIKDSSFFQNQTLKKAIQKAKQRDQSLHLMGLLSDKGVHSYDETCHALLKMAADQGLKEVFVHIFSDGRDTEPKMVNYYIKRLQDKIKEFGVGQIASIMGRWWVMDRDHRWERVERAYKTFTQGLSLYKASSIEEAVQKAYQRGESDEFIKPTLIINQSGNPLGLISEGDVVILFNFRVDRAIEITQAFIEDSFEGFPREKKLALDYICLSEYYKGVPAPFVFKRLDIKNCLSEVLAKENLKQLKVAETEKWIYLTKIFNGIKEKPFKREDRILIPSDKVATYDLKPKMKAMEIAQTVKEKLEEDKHDVIFFNLANPDILGHTGIKKAVIKGIEIVDKACGVVISAIKEKQGTLILVGDHGDAEIIFDAEKNEPHTSHTASDVPFILVSDDLKNVKLKPAGKGRLADVAPTVLDLLGIKKPKEMTGESLINNY